MIRFYHNAPIINRCKIIKSNHIFNNYTLSKQELTIKNKNTHMDSELASREDFLLAGTGVLGYHGRFSDHFISNEVKHLSREIETTRDAVKDAEIRTGDRISHLKDVVDIKVEKLSDKVSEKFEKLSEKISNIKMQDLRDELSEKKSKLMLDEITDSLAPMGRTISAIASTLKVVA